MSKLTVVVCCLFFASFSFADTIGKYMGINTTIPQMQLKADRKAQAWARSARTVLAVTDESIVQTILAMNNVAKQQGNALICPPPGDILDAASLHKLIERRYRQMPSSKRPIAQTVSEFAINTVIGAYPCNNNKTNSAFNFTHQYQIHSESAHDIG